MHGEYILTPVIGTETFDDGTTPLYEIDNRKMLYLLNEDLLNLYPDLQKTYDSPLKLKKFKESKEAEDYLENLRLDKKGFLESTYYAIRDLAKNEVYDLNKCTFTIELPQEFRAYSYYGDPKTPLTTRDHHFSKKRSYNPYFDKFTTLKIDEDTAYEIETNPCEITVFVKFTGSYDSAQAFCRPIKVCISNKKTGQIYMEYNCEQ